MFPAVSKTFLNPDVICARSPAEPTLTHDRVVIPTLRAYLNTSSHLARKQVPRACEEAAGVDLTLRYWSFLTQELQAIPQTPAPLLYAVRISCFYPNPIFDTRACSHIHSSNLLTCTCPYETRLVFSLLLFRQHDTCLYLVARTSHLIYMRIPPPLRLPHRAPDTSSTFIIISLKNRSL